MAIMGTWCFGVVALSLALVFSPAFGQTQDCTVDVQETDSVQGAALLQTKGSSEKEVADVKATDVKVADKKAGVAQHAEKILSDKHIDERKIEDKWASGAKDEHDNASEKDGTPAEKAATHSGVVQMASEKDGTPSEKAATHSGVVQMMTLARQANKKLMNNVKQLVVNNFTAKQTPSCEKACPGIQAAMLVFEGAELPKDFEKVIDASCENKAALSCAAKQTGDICPFASVAAESFVKLTDCFCDACPGLKKAFPMLASEENQDKCSADEDIKEQSDLSIKDCEDCAPLVCPYHEDWKCMGTRVECNKDADVAFAQAAKNLESTCTFCKDKGLYKGGGEGGEGGEARKSKAAGKSGFSFLAFSSVLMLTFVMGLHAC